MNHFMNFESTV